MPLSLTPATVGSLTLEELLSATSSYYVVTGYGATGNGTTLDRAAIQATIDDCSTNGGGTVLVPDGTYLVDLIRDPGVSAIAAAVWLRSNVRLLLTPGATIKLAAAAALPSGCTQAHIVSVINPYTTNQSLLKTNVTVEGGTIDGNANNQTVGTPVILHGLFLGSGRNMKALGVTVKNVYGTASSGSGESFHFEFNDSSGCQAIGCVADGSGATNTATGFSSNNSHDVEWIGCVSHDMDFGQGFTHWQSSALRYIGCYAWNIGAAGFNTERSEAISYSGCFAGGRSPLIGNSNPENPWFTSGQVSLSCAIGWNVQGSKQVALGGCSGTYNTNVGINVQANTAITPTINSDNVTVTGGNWTNNTNGPYAIATSQTNVALGPLRGSSTDEYLSWAGTSPVLDVNAKNLNGLRFVTNTASGVNFAFRWLTAETGTILSLNGFGQLISTGRAYARRATATNYTVVAADHVIGVTSTAAARTITLPAISTLPQAGTTFTVKDESGAAATNNITVTAGGTDTIEGSASKAISTNYGSMTLYHDGVSKWFVI